MIWLVRVRESIHGPFDCPDMQIVRVNVSAILHVLTRCAIDMVVLRGIYFLFLRFELYFQIFLSNISPLYFQFRSVF